MPYKKERTPEEKAESKKLYQYIKAYIDVKGFEADANFQQWKGSYFRWAKQIDEVLNSVALFKEMLNTYGKFLTDTGRTNWNMLTLVKRAEQWKKRREEFKAKYEDKKENN